MAEINLSSFDWERNDEEKIAQDQWVPCRICEETFLRVRHTMRYCNMCKRAFCEGEHGKFTGHGPPVCVNAIDRLKVRKLMANRGREDRPTDGTRHGHARGDARDREAGHNCC